MCRTDENKRIIAREEGVLIGLIGLLQSAQGESQEAAATTLTNIAVDEHCAKLVTHPNIIQPLIILLESQNAVTVSYAVSFFSFLTEIEANRSVIAEFCGIEPLCRLLKHENEEIVVSVSTVLYHIATVDKMRSFFSDDGNTWLYDN